MARPEGTDGTDFKYREIVEDRYKRMAAFWVGARVLMPIQALAVLLKTCWHAIPIIVDGQFPYYYVYLVVVLDMVGMAFFYLSKPKKRIYVGNVKIASACIMLTALMVGLNAYKYYGLDPRYLHYPKRLFKYLKDRGTISSKTWLPALEYFELVLDLAQLGTVALTAVALHNWVTDGIAVEKEIRRRNETAATPAFASPSKARPTKKTR